MAEYSGTEYPRAEQPDQTPERPDVPSYVKDLYESSVEPLVQDDIKGPASWTPSAAIWRGKVRITESEGIGLLRDGPAPPEPRYVIDLSILGESAQTYETATQRAEELREKLTEGTADYLATALGDPVFMAATRGWQTGSFPETEAVDAIEGVSAQIQAGVDTPLKQLGGAVGLSSGEADFAAGIITNVVLAPMTGPLDAAATYIEVAGIIVGFMTGAHGFALACLKLLSHSQFDHLLSQRSGDLLHGSPAAGPQSDSRRPTMRLPRMTADTPRLERPGPAGQPVTHRTEQDSNAQPAQQDSSGTPREDAHKELPRLCLGFTHRQPDDPNVPASGIGVSREFYGNLHKAVVLPPGADEFLMALPTILRHSTLVEVDAATAKAISGLRDRQHFVIQGESLSLGTRNAKRGSRTTGQHPDCRTGDCEPAGVHCRCRCNVCRAT